MPMDKDLHRIEIHSVGSLVCSWKYERIAPSRPSPDSFIALAGGRTLNRTLGLAL